MDRETVHLHVCVFALGFRSVSPAGWYETFGLPTDLLAHRSTKRFPGWPESLAHLPYLEILPKPEQLLTPLQFSDQELQLFKGSHVYGATIDRKSALRSEWEECLEYLTTTSNDEVYRQRYTW